MNHEYRNRAGCSTPVGYAAVRRRVLTLLLVWMFCLSAGLGLGQQQIPMSNGPMASWSGATGPPPMMLPSVPVREPRPAEGGVPPLRWDVGPPTPPTAGLIEALRGNDAIIQVVFGQTRLLTLKTDLTNGPERGSISVGDPTVVDFDLMPNPRVIRLTARRPGVTDLSIITPDGEAYNFEVHVVYDLRLLHAQLQQLYPDAQVRLSQLHGYVVVEGQVRSIRQADEVMSTVKLFLMSHAGGRSQEGRQTGGPAAAGGQQPASRQSDPENQAAADGPSPRDQAQSEQRGQSNVGYNQSIYEPINLLRVPGVHQVMLQVQIAELNRTALRNIGADWRWAFPTGNILQTLIGGPNTTVSGVFPSADLNLVLRALRTNTVLSVLAEPNLVAMSGQKASFLAGGEFPVPVPQAGVGGVGTITVEFKSFGVQLDFVPYVLEDETIRLTVSPEESSPDFSTAVEIGGFFVPGINTRRATTTVEMREGQTLAMAGLMRVSIDANTRRIPGLGDLPYIGPLFSNTSHTRQEKELLVLVTPYLVAPMNPDEVPCLPTDGLTDPNDLEFYLLNRIEGRTGRPFYSTREWDDPWKLRYLMHLEQSGRYGPVGFSAIE
jgi:pilus assembly protein CpaC